MGKIKNNSQGHKRILRTTLTGLILIFPLLFLGVAPLWAATPKIATGTVHTVALKSDGTIWAWGSNFFGQLGDGSTADSHSPVQESTLAHDWVAVAAGGYHTIALKSNGTLWAWGRNLSGQLGDGSTADSHSPVQESALKLSRLFSMGSVASSS